MDEATGAAWVVVGAGGAVETAFLPQRLFLLRADHELRLSAALTPGALDFATPRALAAVTGSAVYTHRHEVDGSGRPLHLAYAEADLLVVAPATARLVAQCALGEVTCPVTRLFAFTPKDRVVVAPALHPRLDRRLYRGHVERLREVGCQVLGGDELFASWSETRAAVLERLKPARRPASDGVTSLWGPERR